jgi:hypothetical protein
MPRPDVRFGSKADMCSAAVALEKAATAAHADAMDMPDGMPCRPDMPENPDCAKDCPLMAVCAGTGFSTPTASAAPVGPAALVMVIALRDDPRLSGLGPAPPPRPPKA